MVSFGKNTTTFLSSFSSSAGPTTFGSPTMTLVPALPAGQFYVITINWAGGIEESRLIIGGVDYFLGHPNSAFPHAAFELSGTMGPLYIPPGVAIQINTMGSACTASGSIYQFSSVS